MENYELQNSSRLYFILYPISSLLSLDYEFFIIFIKSSRPANEPSHSHVITIPLFLPSFPYIIYIYTHVRKYERERDRQINRQR